MPYILSPLITQKLPSQWGEDKVYSTKELYKIDGKLPPVNYSKHTLAPHSLPHAEGSLHTIKEGKSIDKYIKESPDYFFGKVTVVKLSGNGYKKSDNVYHWEVSKDELDRELNGVIPDKLILSTENYPLTSEGFHDPNYILTLSIEAAKYLCTSKSFHMYGTSWKSTDYQPGGFERPIHNQIFTQAVILENLALHHVPSGEYFISAFPLYLEGASESPLTPVLFTKDEISNLF